MDVDIATISASHCQIHKGRSFLMPLLVYEEVYWKQGRYRKERKTYQKSLIIKNGSGYFCLRGFKHKIITYCRSKGYTINWANNLTLIPCTDTPRLANIEFRDYQLRLIHAAIKKQRGVLCAPTGSGKTVIMLGIISTIPESYNILFLCHTSGLLNQIHENLKAYGFPEDSIGLVGGGKKEIKRITIATIQSFAKIYKDVDTPFQALFVDEAHHVSSFKGQYAKVLGSSDASFRIGVTATLPNSAAAKLALEGYIGPVIDKLTNEQAQDQQILAKPIIKLTKVPYNHTVRDLRMYSDVYKQGIIKNANRNNTIIETAKAHIEQGETVLIIIKNIEHGEILAEIARNSYDFKAHFVQGATENNDREAARKLLTSKNIKCVIATAIWKEGIDIPSLNVLINGAGGKSEIATLQTIGRGLRATKNKQKIFIYDFFDSSHPYLISHFGERICLYMDMGWM